MDLPGIKKNIIFSLFFVVLPIVGAGCIYLFFRTSDTVLYQLFKFIFTDHYLAVIRPLIIRGLPTIPSWFIFSFPGGLWVFAFSNFCSLLLNHRTRKYHKKLLILLLIIVCSLEVFQLFGVTDGRFDFLDILLYLIAAIVSLFVSSFRIEQSKYRSIFKQEKKPFLALGFSVCIFCVSIYLADVLH